MMEDFFIVGEQKIDPAGNPPDKSLELFVLEYCEEVLDMPLHVIADASYTDEGIELDLCNLEEFMLGEDWYINLFRLANYARAS